jgi:hypothetical protein
MTKTYRAFVEMTFEPDEHGYLEWEEEYGCTLEELEEMGEKPRTKEEAMAFFKDELWEYLSSNLDYYAVGVEEL